MGAITSGRTNNCTTTASGGVDQVFAASKEQVDTLTYDPTTGVVTGINMVGAAVFYELESEESTVEFLEALTKENGSVQVAQSIEMTWKYRNQTDRNLIMDLACAGCGLVVIHVEDTGKKWIWGVIKDKKRGKVMLTSASGTSGRGLTDANQEVITLSAISSEKAREITAVVPL